MQPARSPSDPLPTAALVFLHGLGDPPRGWASLQRTLPRLRPRLARLQFVFPAASKIPIAISDGAQMPGWFNLYDWPLAVGCVDDRAGLEQAVGQLRTVVARLQASGIDRSRIVVGGFSQGAAVALRTAYHRGPRPTGAGADAEADDETPLAAVVVLSGWLPLADELEVPPKAQQTPCWWAHGTLDDRVLPAQQTFGAARLRERGVARVATTQYPMGHESCPDERAALAKFLDATLFGSENREEP